MELRLELEASIQSDDLARVHVALARAMELRLPEKLLLGECRARGRSMTDAPIRRDAIYLAAPAHLALIRA